MSVQGGKSFQIVVRDNTENQSDLVSDGRALRKGRIRGKNGENLQKYNFKSVAKVGLGIRQARMFNEAWGSYTNDRLRQRRTQTGMLLAQYAIGVKVAGPFGLIYAVGDFGYRNVMYNIDIQKKNREANMLREKAGISTKSGSRHGGDKL